MVLYPKKYSKEKFLIFLEKNNVSSAIINKFEELPKVIINNNNEFGLYIDTTWYSCGNTHHNFELNYYSEELIEYLFNSKVFNDVEVSINYLLCELINNGFIIKNK